MEEGRSSGGGHCLSEELRGLLPIERILQIDHNISAYQPKRVASALRRDQNNSDVDLIQFRVHQKKPHTN